MDVNFRVFSVGSVAIMLGISMLVLGLEILKRKPVLLSPALFRGWLIFLFLLPFIVFAFQPLAERADFDASLAFWRQSLLAVLLLAIFYIPLIFFVGRSFWVLNATQTMLTDALSEVLQKHGIAHSVAPSTSLIASRYGQSQITVDLLELRSSITITSAPMGRAWVRFKHKRHISNYEELVSDFKDILMAKKFEDNMMAYVIFLLAALLIGMTIYWGILAVKGL